MDVEGYIALIAAEYQKAFDYDNKINTCLPNTRPIEAKIETWSGNVPRHWQATCPKPSVCGSGGNWKGESSVSEIEALSKLLAQMSEYNTRRVMIGNTRTLVHDLKITRHPDHSITIRQGMQEVKIRGCDLGLVQGTIRLYRYDP